MAEFNYKAKNAQGEDRFGEVQSPDQRSAAFTLRKKGLIVISVTPKGGKGIGFLSHIFNRVSFTELVIMTRQLATMVSAGLVLSEAIEILLEQQSNKTLKRALQEISQDIKGGLTLAQALGKHPQIFPPLYVNLVKAGETSGRLDQVLNQMADGLEKDREFRARIKGAMIYPIVVLSMMMIVVVIMMAFVIPRLVSLYQQSDIDLPLPTKILIGSSNLFSKFWWLMLIILVSAIVGIRRWRKTPEGNMLLGRLILRLPIIGKITTNVILTNFNRTFALLVTAGIPLLESIEIVTDLTDNPVFKRALKDAYAGVEKGLPFSSVLTADIFPKIVSQMIKVGEETGKVDEIFFKMADYFEQEADHLIKNLSVLIEPIVLVILGIGVAFLVISIILPIYKLTTSF